METKARSRDELLAAGVVRPMSLGRGARQLAVAVLDVSGSMHGQKIADATAALAALREELAAPANRDGFDLGVVAYADSAATTVPVRRASQTAPADLVVRTILGGSTNFAAALCECRVVVDRALAAESRQLRPVVMFLTDGRWNTGPDPVPLAADLRVIADIVCIAFGADADLQALESLATSPQHVARCRNGPELLAYFAQVGRSMSESRASGTQTSIALATIGTQSRR